MRFIHCKASNAVFHKRNHHKLLQSRSQLVTKAYLTINCAHLMWTCTLQQTAPEPNWQLNNIPSRHSKSQVWVGATVAGTEYPCCDDLIDVHC
jgi:hypothetical protein